MQKYNTVWLNIILDFLFHLKLLQSFVNMKPYIFAKQEKMECSNSIHNLMNISDQMGEHSC